MLMPEQKSARSKSSQDRRKSLSLHAINTKAHFRLTATKQDLSSVQKVLDRHSKTNLGYAQDAHDRDMAGPCQYCKKHPEQVCVTKYFEPVLARACTCTSCLRQSNVIEIKTPPKRQACKSDARISHCMRKAWPTHVPVFLLSYLTQPVSP